MKTANECKKAYENYNQTVEERNQASAQKIADEIAEKVYDNSQNGCKSTSVKISNTENDLKKYWEKILISEGYHIKVIHANLIVVSF